MRPCCTSGLMSSRCGRWRHIERTAGTISLFNFGKRAAPVGSGASRLPRSGPASSNRHQYQWNLNLPSAKDRQLDNGRLSVNNGDQCRNCAEMFVRQRWMATADGRANLRAIPKGCLRPWAPVSSYCRRRWARPQLLMPTDRQGSISQLGASAGHTPKKPDDRFARRRCATGGWVGGAKSCTRITPLRVKPDKGG
jgi:hypothetical protein